VISAVNPKSRFGKVRLGKMPRPAGWKPALPRIQIPVFLAS
jgi:hypothetical protein